MKRENPKKSKTDIMCPTCDGIGMIIEDYINEDTDDLVTTPIKCTECNGTGKVPLNE